MRNARHSLSGPAGAAQPLHDPPPTCLLWGLYCFTLVLALPLCSTATQVLWGTIEDGTSCSRSPYVQVSRTGKVFGCHKGQCVELCLLPSGCMWLFRDSSRPTSQAFDINFNPLSLIYSFWPHTHFPFSERLSRNVTYQMEHQHCPILPLEEMFPPS